MLSSCVEEAVHIEESYNPAGQQNVDIDVAIAS